MIDENLLLEDLIYCKGLGRRSFEAVLETINKQPKIEWIPVSERLPEKEHSMYWTTHEDGSIVMHGYSKNLGFIYNWEIGEKREIMGDVIAWMPILKPEPYKE